MRHRVHYTLIVVLGSVSDRDAPYRPLTRPAMNNGARESGVVEKVECLAYLKAAFPFQNLRNFQMLWFAFSQTNHISGRKPKPNTSNILASTFARVQCGQGLRYNDVIMGAIACSNHQPHDCLLNRLFRRKSKKTSKLRVTGLCVGNSPVTDEFPAQMASNAENVSIWWRHHFYQNLGEPSIEFSWGCKFMDVVSLETDVQCNLCQKLDDVIIDVGHQLISSPKVATAWVI